jgi:hypothetical protein
MEALILVVTLPDNVCADWCHESSDRSVSRVFRTSRKDQQWGRRRLGRAGRVREWRFTTPGVIWMCGPVDGGRRRADEQTEKKRPRVAMRADAFDARCET